MSMPYMSFSLGGVLMGVPAQQVIEVSRAVAVELTRMPFAVRHVLGLINLRGTLAVGVDLASCLSVEPSKASSSDSALPSLWVFAQAQQGLLGLRVDAVSDIHMVAPHDLLPPPVALTGAMRHIVSATVALPGALLHVLSLEDIPLQPDANLLSNFAEGVS